MNFVAGFTSFAQSPLKVVEPAILAIMRAIGILSPPRPSITDNLPLIDQTPAQPPPTWHTAGAS